MGAGKVDRRDGRAGVECTLHANRKLRSVVIVDAKLRILGRLRPVNPVRKVFIDFFMGSEGFTKSDCLALPGDHQASYR